MNDLRVLPLRAGTNIPAIRNWQNLASADHEQIAAWRREFAGGCNWGILTGNGLGVMDLDTKNAPEGSPGGFGSLIDIEELLDIDLSSLPLVMTHSGAHLYFRYEGTLPSKVPWVPHIDVKADGGHQVAGPGTVRVVEGVENIYALVRGSMRDIPYAPDALLSAIRGWRIGRPGFGGSPSPGGELPGTADAVKHGLPVNSRNDYMHRLACRWWREFGPSDEGRVWALARDVWEATPGHDTFPWSEAEVAVKSAHRFVALEVDKDLTAISAILKNWSRS